MPYVELPSGFIVWRRTVPLERGEKLERGKTTLRQWYEAPEPGSRPRLIWELDKAFSIWVRRRDERCVLCGKVAGLQASHFWSRRWIHTRWHPANVHAMCPFHNELHNTNQFPYTNFLIEKYGDGILPELLSLRNQKRKVQDFEIAAMLEEYETLNKAA